MTSTGKKQSAAAITIFDHGLSVPNHALVIGANAMIGIAFAAIMYGISAFPSGRQRASASAETIATRVPSTRPPSASLNVIQAPVHKQVAFDPERVHDVGEPRQEEALDTQPVGEHPLPARETDREHDDRGEPAAHPGGDPRRVPWRGRGDAAHGRVRRRRSDRARHRHRVQQLANLGDELEEPRVLARVDPRGCGRSIGIDPGDPTRSR